MDRVTMGFLINIIQILETPASSAWKQDRVRLQVQAWLTYRRINRRCT